MIHHFPLMALYALLLGVFFATLWKRQRRAQVRMFLQVFGGLVGGAIVLGWLMYFLPASSPTSLP